MAKQKRKAKLEKSPVVFRAGVVTLILAVFIAGLITFQLNQENRDPLPTDFMVGASTRITVDNPDEAVNLIADDLHLNWLQLDISWREIEPENNDYQWESLDAMMQSATDNNLYVMLTIRHTPEWARDYQSRRTDGPPANYSEFTEFLAALLMRFPNRIDAIEIWQEQNIQRNWDSVHGLSVENYVRLLEESNNTIRAMSPHTIIISGALSPTGVDDGIHAVDDFRYMQQMIDAGMLNLVDCVGIKNYGYNIPINAAYDRVPNDPGAIFRGPFDNPHHSWPFISTLEGYRNRIQNAGYETSFCVTQFGWASSEDMSESPPGLEFALDNTLEEQANFMSEALTVLQNRADIRLAFVSPLPDPIYDMEKIFSFFAPDGTRRPIFDAVAEWAQAQ